MGNDIEKREAIGMLPSELIRVAVDKGADLDKLEKLLALQERYDRNEAKKAYNKAMTDFKANPPQINKDKRVSYGAGRAEYNHASLYNVTDKINAELSKHGLSASWATKQNGQVVVTCKITHVKGHSEETELSAPADASGGKNAIQAIGSTVTYLERYTLLALTGLATFEQDDDGKATQVECIDEKQVSQITDFLSETNVNMEKFCKAFGIEEIKQLPKARFDQAITALKAKMSK